MTNSIIIPILVIIICLIIVYGILSYKFNKKIINTIESFETNLQINNLNQFKENLQNNIEITSQIANGTWTTYNTVVDSNYNANEFIMNININQNSNNENNNYGTVVLNKNNELVFTCNITSILNGCIVTSNIVYSGGFTTPFTIFIQFVGLADEATKDEIQNQVYYVNTTQMAIISIFSDNILVIKYASYKIYNNQVDSLVYPILKSKSFYINNPPAIYDYDTYNVIVNSYKFPSNPISFTFSNNNNSTILSTIQNNYLGNIVFAIQRVFNSPNGKKIITNLSPQILVNPIQNSILPDTIQIVPLSVDKEVNNLTSFYVPISTIVYFYKFTSIINTKYGYNNPNISTNSSVMNFNNNGNLMFNQSLQYPDINSVYQKNNYQYNIQYLTTINSNMNEPSIINFSILSAAL
jgi:hypothetical protein